MAIQPIRLLGDPVLQTPADPVVDFDAELRRLVADLFETMLDVAPAGNSVRAGQAACTYSWRMPPRWSWRRMLRWAIRSGSSIAAGKGRNGAASAMPWWGR